MTARGSQVALWLRRVSAAALTLSSALIIFFASQGLMGADHGSHVLHVTHIAVAVALFLLAVGVWLHPRLNSLYAWGCAGTILAFPIGRLLGTYLYLPAEAMDDLFPVVQVLLGAILAALVFWILNRARSIVLPHVEPNPVSQGVMELGQAASTAPEPNSGVQHAPPDRASAPHVSPPNEIVSPITADRVRDASPTETPAAAMSVPPVIGHGDRGAVRDALVRAWSSAQELVTRPRLARVGTAALASTGLIVAGSFLLSGGDDSADLAGEFAACDVSIRNAGWHVSASAKTASVGVDGMPGGDKRIKFAHEGLGGYTSHLDADITLYADEAGSFATHLYLQKDGKRVEGLNDKNAFAIFNNRAQDEIMLRGRFSYGLFVAAEGSQKLVDLAAKSTASDERIQGVYFVNGSPVAQLFFSPAGLEPAYKKAAAERIRIAKLVKRGACAPEKSAGSSSPARDAPTPNRELAKGNSQTPTPSAGVDKPRNDRSGSSGPSGESVDLFAGPTANQIRDALQREFAARLARVDAMAAQCHTFKEQNNPIGAALCLMTGGGALSSKSIQVSIKSVTVDRCVVSDKHDVYCRYSADTNMQGSGMAGQVASTFNTFLALEGWTYSSFHISNGRWEWLKTYSSCDFAGDKIQCQWTERR